MGWKAAVRERVTKAQFDFDGGSGWLAMFCNPFYFTRRALFRNVKELAPRLSGRLLDFGCGCKPYERLFAHCAAYVGCDIAVSGHDHANEDIDIYYDGHHIPLDDGAMDSIFASEVFEHIFNLPEILQEINRVLKTGGVLLITVPFVWNEHEIPYDFGRYTSFGLKYLLEQAGFEVVEMRKSNTYVGALLQMAMEYVRKTMAEHLSGKVLFLAQCIVFPPVVLFGRLLDAVLPDDDSFYNDNIFLCRKVR